MVVEEEIKKKGVKTLTDEFKEVNCCSEALEWERKWAGGSCLPCEIRNEPGQSLGCTK